MGGRATCRRGETAEHQALRSRALMPGWQRQVLWRRTPLLLPGDQRRALLRCRRERLHQVALPALPRSSAHILTTVPLSAFDTRAPNLFRGVADPTRVRQQPSLSMPDAALRACSQLGDAEPDGLTHGRRGQAPCAGGAGNAAFGPSGISVRQPLRLQVKCRLEVAPDHWRVTSCPGSRASARLASGRLPKEPHDRFWSRHDRTLLGAESTQAVRRAERSKAAPNMPSPAEPQLPSFLLKC
jgi:hypothetical protein